MTSDILILPELCPVVFDLFFWERCFVNRLLSCDGNSYSTGILLPAALACFMLFFCHISIKKTPNSVIRSLSFFRLQQNAVLFSSLLLYHIVFDSLCRMVFLASSLSVVFSFDFRVNVLNLFTVLFVALAVTFLLLPRKSYMFYFKQGLRSSSLTRSLWAYSIAILLNPSFSQAFNNKGVVHLRKRKHQQAIVDFNNAIHLNPNFIEAFNNRGLAYLSTENYQLALPDFITAISIDPTKPSYLNNRGVVYHRISEITNSMVNRRLFQARAVNDFRNALLFSPNDPDILRNLSLL
ncbi:hypothetical protein RCL1_006061 [Eukaryota sp. TZLM3-RCL]